MEKSKAKNVSYHKGWFNETLKDYNPKKGIAVLRMDADWYEATMDILQNLFYKVNKGGVVIVDDYFVWDGCSRAIHDFFQKTN